MTTSFRNAVGASLLGLAAALSAPTASAAIITGSWDPILPAPFVNLGWVSTVNLQITDNCVFGGSGTYSVSIFGSSFGCSSLPTDNEFTVLRAQVGLYSTVSGAIVDVLTFAPPPGPLGVDLVVQGLNNFLLTLNESQAVGATAPGTLGLSFMFAIPGALPVLSYQDTNEPGTFIPATGDPVLTLFDVQPNSAKQTVLDATVLTVGDLVAAPAAVPEPGSLALVLLALGAAGAAAGRRTRRAHDAA